MVKLVISFLFAQIIFNTSLKCVLGETFQKNLSPRSLIMYDRQTAEEDRESLEHGIRAMATKAEDLVNSIIQASDDVKNELGLDAKGTLSGFANADFDQAIQDVQEILKDLKYSLERTVGCRGCYVLHQEMHDFLKWLLRDENGNTYQCDAEPVSVASDYLFPDSRKKPEKTPT